MRKTSNNQPNLTFKATRKKEKKKYKYQSRNKWERNERKHNKDQ